MQQETSRHQCLIYEGAPSKKLPVVTAVIRRKLNEGYRCMYLNSAPMVTGLRSYMASTGVDVVSEIAKARLILSSEPVTRGRVFDIDGMLFKLEDALNQALKDGYKGLWATGDMSWEFGIEKDFRSLLEYEWRLEELFRRRPEISGICQYHQGTLPPQVMREGLIAHQSVFVNETLTRINPHHVASKFSDQRATNKELDEMITALCQFQEQ